jgi:hypothetical protein
VTAEILDRLDWIRFISNLDLERLHRLLNLLSNF